MAQYRLLADHFVNDACLPQARSSATQAAVRNCRMAACPRRTVIRKMLTAHKSSSMQAFGSRADPKPVDRRQCRASNHEVGPKP